MSVSVPVLSFACWPKVCLGNSVLFNVVSIEFMFLFPSNFNFVFDILNLGTSNELASFHQIILK